MNDKLGKIADNPIFGQWEDQNGEVYSGILHYSKSNKMLYIEIELSETVEEITFSCFKLSTQKDGCIYAGMIKPISFQHLRLYGEKIKIPLDYAMFLAQQESIDKALKQINFNYEFVLTDTFPVSYTNQGSEIIKRMGGKTPKVETNLFEATLSFSAFSSWSSRPPRYSVETDGMQIAINTYNSPLTLYEILEWSRKFREYLSFITGADVPLKEINLGDRFGELVIPSLIAEQQFNLEDKQFCNLTVENLETIFSSTFQTYMNKHEEYKDIIRGLGLYGSSKKNYVTTVQLPRLIATLDATTNQYVESHNISDKSEEQRKKEYDKYLENAAKVHASLSRKLRTFLKKEAKESYIYRSHNFKDNIIKLAKYLEEKELYSTILNNNDYADALRRTRNDLMHGRAINTKEDYIKTVLETQNLLTEIEFVIRIYVLFQLGLSGNDIAQMKRALWGS